MNVIRNDLLLILAQLKTINLHKVILFGSFAYGQPHQHSDIDLLVITDDDYCPASHHEKSELHLKVSNALADLAGKMPIDLIVFTKTMYRQFITLGSLFAKEISQHGVVLYEANHERMAGQGR